MFSLAAYAKACFDVFAEGYLRQAELDLSMFQYFRSTMITHVVGIPAGDASMSTPPIVTSSPSASLPRAMLSSVFRLQQVNTRLLELDLSGCSRLASENFPLIVMACPMLQLLRLIGCTQVSRGTTGVADGVVV